MPPLYRELAMKLINITLGEYSPLMYGKSLPSANRDSSGHIPVYGSGGIIGSHKESYVKDGGIIVGRKGTIGSIYLSKQSFWPIDTVFYISKNDKKELIFNYYLLKSLPLSKMNSDSAVPGLNRNNAHLLKIKIPENKNDRYRIAKILGDIDDVISINKSINTALERFNRTIFKSWFIDFNPVHAKKKSLQAGLNSEQAERAAMASISGICSPNEFAENFKKMNKLLTQKLSKMSKEKQKELAQTASFFPNEFKDSEFGKIPNGWLTESLDSYISFLNGLALQKFPPNKDGTDLPILKIAQLQKGVAKGGGFSSKDIADRFIIKDGDLIFSWSASLMVKIWCGGDAALNQHLFKVTSDVYPTWFQWQWCIFHLQWFQEIAKSKTTTMGHIQRKHLKEAKIVVPPKNTLNAFNNFFEPITKIIINNAFEVKRLENLKNTLLPKLLAGEIDLKNIELEATDE